MDIEVTTNITVTRGGTTERRITKRKDRKVAVGGRRRGGGDKRLKLKIQTTRKNGLLYLSLFHKVGGL